MYVLSQNPELLQSWKEIAVYLRRGVRTVQRYEQEFRLPVRRVDGNRRSVLAFKSDLDKWLHNTFGSSLEVRSNTPIISQLHESISEGANLRLQARALRIAHRECALQLHSSLKRVMDQIHPR